MARNKTYAQALHITSGAAAGVKDVPQADIPGCQASNGHNLTRPTQDFWGAAVYIERDGARRVQSVVALRAGVNLYHGPAGPGCYSFTVADSDMPKLDAARDRAYAKYR